ncbi:MAG: hypothetical protein IJP82_02120 [Bacteroidaceae bacterium]|nr:hypothetical protein [Bacteroidaceae bacterium]MBQ6964472.1 hypothetical protein [Bacteroidaceae bacterium]
MPFVRFTQEQLDSCRHRYLGDDLFRTWVETLSLLELKGELNPVEIWNEAELLRVRLSEVPEHRDMEMHFFMKELMDRYSIFQHGEELTKRSEDAATATALCVMTVLFSQLCDAGNDVETHPHKAMCRALAKIITNPTYKEYPEKLIKAFTCVKQDNEGKEIVLPITDYMQMENSLERIDEVARGEIEAMVKDVLELTKGVRALCRIEWDTYESIWRTICAENGMMELLRKMEPRNNAWGKNLKMVCNVLGLMKDIHIEQDGKKDTLIENNVSKISDAIEGKPHRDYIAKCKDFGVSNCIFTKKQCERIEKIISAQSGTPL